MTSSEIRESFLQFFKQKGHTIVPSSPVIPYNDPTLLFTNAGMNQFKDVFLGTGTRPYTRAVDTQKCIRVSGKHNDLEEVGRDTYHHTFFEMLGNWSFGDYYKKEAIAWAWELLTEVWKLPKHRLWATVYKEDDEAEELWKSITDIDHSHILRFGEKENFWEMGETGPCGPCSEIHIDRTPTASATASMVNAGSPDLIEIWNLVFIQFNRDESGALTPLPAKHVDTGMGFERICAVLQNKTSNYETDVFSPLINAICDLTHHSYAGTLPSPKPTRQEEIDVAIRVIADHIRTLTFAIGDGALPTNEGRGYVLRRILRRAARFGRTLNMHEAFIYKLVPTLVETMGSLFPEIRTYQDHIQKVIKGEEEAFNATLDRGLERFEEIARKSIANNQRTIAGEEVFRLYDTYGFPVDLTALLAQEKGLTLDMAGFDSLMELQRSRSRESSKASVSMAKKLFSLGSRSLPPTIFVGYTELECEATVIDQFDTFVVLDRTPFYAESGGQVGDTGVLYTQEGPFNVQDTQKDADVFGHNVIEPLPNLVGQKVRAVVHKDRRLSIMRNHSATHLLHNALRTILGPHVQQAGSHVAPDYLRFDFTHYSKVTEDELEAIETLVNQKIAENIPRTPGLNNIPFEEAKKLGALMFFGDKYGDLVNVIQFGNFSIEFCGGTHVQSTGEIKYFKIISEGSIASGIRRIEAVTNSHALEALKLQDRTINDRIDSLTYEITQLRSIIDELDSEKQDCYKKELHLIAENLATLRSLPPVPNVASNELSSHFALRKATVNKLITFAERISELRKQIEKERTQARLQSKTLLIETLIQNARTINGHRIATGIVPAESLDELKALGDTLRTKLQSGVGVLATILDGKVQLVCVVTDDLLSSNRAHAGAIVSAIAKLINGGGGGKPHLATAGGKDTTKLNEALAAVDSIVRTALQS
ncbi:MAG: alanine--tRNA ligase [Bacteroidetes bacterium]|nr:alanine--tRNA ligase [Bacteroidota bacterium]